MGRRRGANGTDAAVSGSDGPLTDQSTLEFLCKSVHNNEHWRPTKALARCLGVPHARLLLATRKDDPTNLVWSTVLALCCCATRLADYHEAWYELAATATAWLFQQPSFADRREDLVSSACALLRVRDAAPSLLASLFAEPPSIDADAEALALAGWQLCYLQEPPYSVYYWNAETNQSTWRHPLETAKEREELLERRRQRAELLRRVLPQRLRINRDVVLAHAEIDCSACGRAPAEVLCIACEQRVFCGDCCDRVHCEKDKFGHCSDGRFRFRECVGRSGFRGAIGAADSSRKSAGDSCEAEEVVTMTALRSA